MTTALADLEAAEFAAFDALSQTAPGSRRALQLRDALAKAREAKASLLAASPDILRKTSVKLGIGLPVPGAEVAKFAREELDRQAEERRLAKGRRRKYQAPPAFCGTDLKLVDGRTLRIPSDGQVDLEMPDDGEMAAAVHGQLKRFHFVKQPDEDPGEVIKSALARPIVGDRAFLAFLSRNAAA
jgi:hypothetical protein